MNSKAIIAASACAVLVGVTSATVETATCGTNACACAGVRGRKGPARPLTLKIEKTTSDADVAAFKSSVLARIDETVKKARAKDAKDECPPVTVRLVVDDGRRGPPPPRGGRGAKGRSLDSRPGERPEPPDGEPPPEKPAEQ